MNVLLFVSKGEAPADLLTDLKHGGHLVNSVNTAKAALELIARDPPDIAVVSGDLAADAFGTILQAVLGADDLYRSLVVLVGKDTPERRTALYSAGVEDVAGPTVTPRELASRIKAAERIVRLERRLRERVRELESALSRLEMNAIRRGQALAGGNASATPPVPGPFLLARSWTGVEEILGKMCAEYLRAPFQLVAGLVPPAAGSPGATVSLVDVEHELRIDLTFFAPVASARAIAIAFCGDESLVDDDVMRDVILELTNSGMGAVKGAFLNDGFKFAGSTPKAKVFTDLPSLHQGAEARRMLTYRFVHAVLAVRPTPRIRVKANMLREGMIVAVDVINEAGVLMVPGGTRLTETAAERIRRLMPRGEFDLADPNAAG
jgi:AmiR/NasT family two-component response regulator